MAQEHILKVIELSKSYGEVLALNKLSLSIRQGEIFGLLGPNGAGKTTAISLISGIRKPDSGQILISGRTVEDYGRNYRLKIGLCSQHNTHWKKLTPQEQLHFLGQMYQVPRSEVKKRAGRLLESLGLSDVKDRQAEKLSGGMQRRLNIALALIHDPEIVILDEPETGLDPQSRISVREYIKTLAATRTVILTTHNMDEAHRMSDRVAIIDQGKLLVLDEPDLLVRGMGAGDVLEIETDLGNFSSEEIEKILPPEVQVLILGGAIQVRGLDLTNRLPAILSGLEEGGVSVGEIRLRKNTLEDVFIQLTGRRLRD